MISGTYNLIADPNWKQLPIQEVRLECDTTLAPVIINLFKIADLEGFYNVKIFVIDKTNNASVNNITINAGAGNTIDGSASVVLNQNGAVTEIQIVSADQLVSFESTGGLTSVPQKVVTVDATFGNDATAQPYNAAKPYQTVDAAIAAAGVGDLISINPGDYVCFSNCLQKGLSYSLKAGSNLFLFSGSTSAAGESYSFTGQGSLSINGTIQFIGDYNGKTVFDVDVLTFNSFIYFDNAGYYAAPVNGMLQLIIKANKAINNNPILAVIYPGIVQLTAKFGTYTSAITAGTADFWAFGGGVYTFPVNSTIHIDNAVINTNGTPSPFFRVTFGTAITTTLITGNYRYTNSSGAAARPFFINVDSTTQVVYFDGVANITDASMVYDQAGTIAKISIAGKVYQTDTIGIPNGLVTCYLIQTSTLVVTADTFSNSAVNPIINQAGGQIDLKDCQIVNTVAGAPSSVYKQGGSMRLWNAKVMHPTTSIAAPGGAPQTVEVYSCYANTATAFITNTMVATAIIVDPAVTSNSF